MIQTMADPVMAPYQECDLELASDSPELRLELTCDDEAIVYGDELPLGSTAAAPGCCAWPGRTKATAPNWSRGRFGAAAFA